MIGLKFYFSRPRRRHDIRYIYIYKRKREINSSSKCWKRIWEWRKERNRRADKERETRSDEGGQRKVGRGGSREIRFEKISSQLPMARLINLGAISSSPSRTPRHEIQFSSAWRTAGEVVSGAPDRADQLAPNLRMASNKKANVISWLVQRREPAESSPRRRMALAVDKLICTGNAWQGNDAITRSTHRKTRGHPLFSLRCRSYPFLYSLIASILSRK